VISVLLAEDHQVVRAGLVELLGSEEDIEIVGAVGDGATALESALERRPDVVLLDIAMPELTGIEVAERILGEWPEARIVMLTASAGREQIIRAIDAGALGYMLKDASPDELIDGIRAASRGEAPLDPKAARELLADRRETRAPELTDREREVLGLVAAGMPNKRIAMRLEISEKTVKAHLTRVYERIGVSDRTQAALWAREHGI
jgi:DNA-binding NarL/FixJ family response regulator